MNIPGFFIFFSLTGAKSSGLGWLNGPLKGTPIYSQNLSALYFLPSHSCPGMNLTIGLQIILAVGNFSFHPPAKLHIVAISHGTLFSTNFPVLLDLSWKSVYPRPKCVVSHLGQRAGHGFLGWTLWKSLPVSWGSHSAVSLGGGRQAK